MAPSSSPSSSSSSKPAPKGLAGTLKKKVGPLPMWAWIGLGGGALFLGYYLMRGSGGGGGDAGGGPELVSGTGGYTAQDAAAAGQPSTATAPSDMLGPGILDSILAGQSQIAGELVDVRDSQAEASASLYDAVSSLISSYGDVQASPAAPAGGGPAGVAGVKWGGQTFTTRAGIARELGAHGQSYQAWAVRHPQAAALLTGPAPKPAAPKKAKPQPKPKAKAPARPVTPRKPAAAPAKKPAAKKPAPKKPAPKKKPAGRR